MVCCLLISLSYFNFRPEAGRKTEWVLRRSEEEFSFVLVEAPTNFRYNSLKADGCSGEDVLAVKFSQRVS